MRKELDKLKAENKRLKEVLEGIYEHAIEREKKVRELEKISDGLGVLENKLASLITDLRKDDKRADATVSNDVLLEKLNNLSEKVEEIRVLVKQDYVTRNEFDPVKRIVYGLVGIVGVAIATAVVNLVVVK